MAADRTYDLPALTVSVAADLAGMHPQTLRTYDRLGLVVPQRTPGRGRRYSLRDVAALREVQRLSAEGVNLEGIRRILELEREVSKLTALVESLRASADPGSRVFAATVEGEVVAVPRGRRPGRSFGTGSLLGDSSPIGSRTPSHSAALVVWRGGR